MPLPENLRYLMKARGLSAPELAERLGRSQSVVYGWLRGAHTPARTTLKKLAECFDVPPRALLEVNLAQEVERPRGSWRVGGDPLRMLLQLLRSLTHSGTDEVRDFGPVVVLSGRAKEVFDELRSIEATLATLAGETAANRSPTSQPDTVSECGDPVDQDVAAGEPFQDESPIARNLAQEATGTGPIDT